MSGDVLRWRGAHRDVQEHYLWLGARSEPAAERFLAALEATLRRAVGMPGLGAPLDDDAPELAGIRCLTVDGFPNHLVFYRPVEGGIEILRVLHGARDLGQRLRPDETG